MISLDSPIEAMGGIGPKMLLRLHHLKIKKIRDLLFYFPFRYEDFSNIKKIADLIVGEKATVTARVLNIGNKRTWKRHMTITESLLEDKSAPIRAVWFHQPYLADTLKKGTWVNISGKVNLDNMGLVFSNPVFEILGSEDYQKETPPDGWAGIHTGGLVAVYPETQGLSSRWLRLKIKSLIDNFKNIPDFMPDFILQEFNLIQLSKALSQIHFPKTNKEAEEAQKRLAFQDLFLLQLYSQREKEKIKSKYAAEIPINIPLVKKFISSLPFQLTNSQRLSSWQILQDISKPSPMNRLLEGDVGSGKTVVASIAALSVSSKNYQTAFLAPTEILAEQHFKTISKLLNGFPIEIALLTSAQSKLLEHEKITKKELAKRIYEGKVHVVVGTHALIQKEIKFGNLAFVVVDEQHRFGVEQRASLLRRSTQNMPISDTKVTNTPELHEQNQKHIVERELSYKLCGIFFEIQREIGRYCRERQYADLLEQKLKNSGLSFVRENPIEIADRKSNFADFIIENKIITEIKAKPFFEKNDYYQISRYLENKNIELGMLVNFRQQYLKPKRIVNSKFKSFGTFVSNSDISGRNSAVIPHLLSMTATPIPRTLALTMYGDLDLSLLKELPKGRKKIITKIVAPANRNKAYDFIENQIKTGRQAFVICPLIEESESMIMSDVKAATKEYEKLSKEIFPHLKIGLLHGKMPPKEKEEIMKNFKDKKIDVLVSTSVIEVGIDIPNASVMMIEGADRFGLSQLHQFRGRVGRAEHQSYCFLFTESPAKATSARLRAVVECEDGFKLAEKDLQIRGPGQFFGKEQSGIPDLAMSSLKNPKMIEEVQQAVKIFLEKSKIENHPHLKIQLASFKQNIHWE